MDKPVSVIRKQPQDRDVEQKWIIYSCEHAGNDVSYLKGESRSVASDEVHFLDEHWGYDIGAAALTQALIERTGGTGVFANYSRLICDPNRNTADSTFILTEIGEQSLSFNQDLSDEAIQRRIDDLYTPYHSTLKNEILTAQETSPFLFSVHSFTPIYQGQKREMEIGVLFDQFDDAAALFADLISEHGFNTALNQPYSGYDESIYSASAHGHELSIPYLELEVRQDLLSDPNQFQRIVHTMHQALTQLLTRHWHLLA